MTFTLVALLIFILLMLTGIFIGKTLPEKIMSLCCLTNYVIVLLCFLSLFTGRESFVDIAYIYGLLGFAVNLGISKLKERQQK
ncbi:MAG: monovalent cation/H+ antiporter complex subunit F [Rickettsiales bacterium]|nr:monovalent cation/H+ antiporter complex subunit F [Rickettsiales bacterium]